MAIKLKEVIQVNQANLDALDDLYDKIEGLKEGEYTVYILDKRPKRSLPQNKYYWGVVLKVLQEFSGYTTGELHDHFRKKFIPTTVTFSSSDSDDVVGRSTTDLDTKNFMEYVEKIRMWAIENEGWYIPLPQEVTDKDEYTDLYIYAMDLKV